ncbi:MAG: replication-relaxation family protein [Solirubrobacteraceae bacterium]
MDSDLSRLAEANRAVLGPLAEHRVLTVTQVAHLLGASQTTTVRRLRELRRPGVGLVAYERSLRDGPGVAAITKAGLRALGLDTRQRGVPARISMTDLHTELNPYNRRHDIGVAWLWIAARQGRFGEPLEILTERTMISADRTASYREHRFSNGSRFYHGLGTGLIGPSGNPRRHYPDLLLTLQSGNRVAVELELSLKSPRQIQPIMTAYASDARVHMVLYFTDSDTIAKAVLAAARRSGIADLVRVQRITERPAACGTDSPVRLASIRRQAVGHTISRSAAADRAGAQR